MKTSTDPAVRDMPDAELVVFDFAADYAERPEEALGQLHLLLVDRASCLGRIAFLRELRDRSAAKARPAEDYTAEIARLAAGDLFDAQQNGELTEEQIGRLHRLTCDPDALWTAYRTLAALAEPAPKPSAGDTHLPGDTDLGATAVARAGRWPELAERLRPWLPLLLRRAGLADDLADDLLAFVQRRLSELGNRRLRAALPGWVADFARERGAAERMRPLPAEIDAPLIDELALRRTLDQPGAADTELMREVRAYARTQPLVSTAELLSLTPPGREQDPRLSRARSELYVEARAQIAEAEAVLQ